MTVNIKSMRNFAALTSFLLVFALGSSAPAAETKIKKDKLQIVFLMGQSNMVGLAEIGTSWYLTQPQYVPPKEPLMKKTDSFEWNNFFWQGVRYYKGPPALEKELEGLLDAREKSRGLWRNRAKGKDWKEEWGPKPDVKGRDAMYALLDTKTAAEGVFAKMEKILSGPENQFTMDKAYEEIIHRDEHNAEQLKRLREIYLNGTKGEDFDSFHSQLDLVKRRGKKGVVGAPEGTPEQVREFVAKLGEKTVKLPIAKRTHIFNHGAFENSSGSEIQGTAHGPLSIGWGGSVTNIGPEYGLGITLERLVDAPIFFVFFSCGM